MSAIRIEHSELTNAEVTLPSKTINDSVAEWTPAYFNPPLAAERNGWVLNQLRRFSIRTILDIGCGEGLLLRSLCEPSLERYDPCTPLTDDVSSRPLYPVVLAGLDTDLRSVKAAAECTIPREFNPAAPRYAPNGIPRWDELTLRLWHGGIEHVNEDFVDRYQCFVSMEVERLFPLTPISPDRHRVEHLQEDILELFLPLVLGYYRPEYLLLTTPNYLYNELFSAPIATTPIVEPYTSTFVGFPDPTGKTTRVFRHADHKREWTPAEWREWCEEGARKHGYSVELSSVGWLGRPDPFGRELEGDHGGSLTAVFRRIDGRERVLPAKLTHMIGGSRGSAFVPAPSHIPATSHEHTLVAEYLHTAHLNAGSPLTAPEILSRVRDVFSQSSDNELPFETLWLSNRIDIACGGSPRTLLEAFLTSESELKGHPEEYEWEITQGPSSDLLSWFVLWRKWTQPPSLEQDMNVWATEGDGSQWDGITEDGEYHWPTSDESDMRERETAEARTEAQTEGSGPKVATNGALDEWHNQCNTDTFDWVPSNDNGWE